jgi:2-keto-4-pentenoate hydratase/2-oxohepta-3-ene-1,7-dioic acid hydratase in catechol pathway
MVCSVKTQPARWIRFSAPDGQIGFGTLEDDQIVVHAGELFDNPTPTSDRLALSSVDVLAPCQPTKMIGLWNNLRAAATKQGWGTPPEPLFFLKPPSCFVGHLAPIRRPSSYEGRILYEGELGIVIGRECVDVEPGDVDDVIFGYTCVNDVTALGLITADESFAQWSRGKGFDTFGPFGPVIATGIDPDSLIVRTLVGGKVRQDYPVSDMVFSPRELVSLISQGMTLMPGDIISCGTSTGAMPMRPGVMIDVEIDGIGLLSNSLQE